MAWSFLLISEGTIIFPTIFQTLPAILGISFGIEDICGHAIDSRTISGFSIRNEIRIVETMGYLAIGI